MSTDDDENLICPITQEYFRDPVRAGDGRLYERAAITRWINEHGTSPFTRQALYVKHLQPDDEIRRRVEERHRLSVSYNRDTKIVHFPPIGPASNILLTNRIIDISRPPQSTNRQTCYDGPCHVQNKSRIFACICAVMCVLTPVIVFAALLTGRKITASSTTYSTRYNIPIPPNLCYPLTLNTSTFNV